MTSKDLSIFNSLRPFSIGFDDMFDQFESMLGNGSLSMQSNYPPYNIRKTGKDAYSNLHFPTYFQIGQTYRQNQSRKV